MLEGRLGAPWAKRAGRVRSLVQNLIGPDGPGELARAEAQSPAALARPRPARPLELARDFLDAWTHREWSELGPMLASRVWVLWPDGSLACHPKQALLQALPARAGADQPAMVEDLRGYAPAELEASLGRGIGRAHTEALDAHAFVSASIMGPGVPPGRILLALRDEGEGHQVGSFPLPSPDEALCASARIRPGEPRERAVVDALGRAFVLGQARRFAAAGPDLALPSWLDDRLVTPADLVRALAEGPHRYDASEIAFEAARELTGPPIEQGLLRRLTREAVPRWDRPLERIAPRWFGLGHGTWSSESERLVDRRELHALVVGLPEPDGTGDERVRRRIAGWFTGGRREGSSP